MPKKSLGVCVCVCGGGGRNIDPSPYFPGNPTGKLGAEANGQGNSPGNAAAARLLSREIIRGVERTLISRGTTWGVPRKIGRAVAVFPGGDSRLLDSPGDFHRNWMRIDSFPGE